MRSIGAKITGVVGVSMLLMSAVIVFSVHSIYRQHMEEMTETASELALQIFRESGGSLLALLSILIVGVAVIVMALRVMLVRRLTAISRHIVRSTAPGDYSRMAPLEVGGDDEISVVAESFNILTEQIHCGKDGKDVQVEASTSPVLDPEGNVVQVVLVIRDISARKESEAAQKAARLAAEDASRAKGQFLANMSHEIRTPLNGIIGMSELALDTVSDEDQKKIFNTINSEAAALMTMVNDVLDFSKIESGSLELERNSFDMRHLVEDLAERERKRT
jgi:signal transduction histidine kinase